MRLITPAIIRGFYHDRNAKPVISETGQTFTGYTAAHMIDSYSIPQNSKAKLNSISWYMMKTTASTLGCNWGIWFYINPAGSSQTDLYMELTYENTVHWHSANIIALTNDLTSQDVVEVWAHHSGFDGAVLIRTSFSLTVYDA